MQFGSCTRQELTPLGPLKQTYGSKTPEYDVTLALSKLSRYPSHCVSGYQNPGCLNRGAGILCP